MTKEDSSKIHNLSNYKLKNFGFNGITFYKFKFIDNNKILLLNNKAFLSIFSVDDVFIENIAKNINKNKIYRIDGMFFNVTNYRIINKQFIGNNFVLKTVDPISLTCKINNKFTQITYQNDKNKFIDLLLTNLNKKCNSNLKKDDIEIISAKQKYIQYKYNSSKKCTNAIIRIKCNADIINTLYYSGLGMLNSAGFGSFQILK